jgi:MFS family permease
MAARSLLPSGDGMSASSGGERRSPQGWAALVDRPNAPSSAMVAGGSTLYALFMFIVATVLPSAAAEIGGVAYYAWVTTLFFVGSIVGSASTAPLVARLAPRDTYRLGIGLFLAGSACCALAPGMAALIAGRTLQGIGGGLFTTLASSMIPALFPETLRSRAIALMSGVGGAAALAGPLLGGMLAEIGLWRGAFWIALPLALAVVHLGDRVLPRRVPQRIASVGAASLPPGLRLALIAAAALALSAGSVTGRLAAAAVGIGAAIVCLGVALRLDRRAAHRILPRGAFALGTAAGAASATMALLVLGVGTTPFVPYVLSVAHGASPLFAGYVAALSSLSWSLAGLASAGAGPAARRRIMALAPLVTTVGMLGVATALSAGSIPLAAGLWALFGAGIGLAWPHLAAASIALSSSAERDLAAGFLATLQIGAVALGTALAGMAANIAGLAKAATPGEAAQGAFWLYAIFAAAPVAACVTTARLLTMPRALRR